MRDPMALLGAFLLGLVVASAYHRHQLRKIEADRDAFQRAFSALADVIEREEALFQARVRAEQARGQR